MTVRVPTVEDLFTTKRRAGLVTADDQRVMLTRAEVAALCAWGTPGALLMAPASERVNNLMTHNI